MIGMFLAEGNLVFVQRSSNLSDGDHILPTQALDLETNLGCFGVTSNLNQKRCFESLPLPTRPFRLTWIHN